MITIARVAVIAGLLALAGCAGPSVILLKNPSTGELHQCGAGGGFSYVQDTWEAKECADAYVKQGWQRTN